jgi:type I restriction enzyme R subunit
MYADKPMRGHGLMQAIARVNRVFKDKPGGLIVDYLGLADQLKRAMRDYTEAGGKGQTTIDQQEAVEALLKQYEVIEAMFYGFDYSAYFTSKPADRVKVIPAAIDFIEKQNEKKPDDALKQRFLSAVLALSKAFALSVPHPKALAIRDQVGFFQAIRAGMVKYTVTGQSEEDLDAAVRQIVSRAVSTEGVIDIFAAAGMKSPDISILSDEFLDEVRRLPQKNLAMELLRKLLNDEIKTRSKKNLVQSRSFAEMLEKTIRAYQNRSVDTAQVIAELVEMARKMREARQRGEELHMSDDELAFYDALEVNDAAVKVMGDAILRQIAHELTDIVRRNTTIDWTMKENVRAKLRTLVKRLLRKYGYPPDKQEKATQTVLEQAELVCKGWAAA